MQISDLIPWGRDRKTLAPQGGDTDAPLQSLQQEINRAFDTFWNRFDRSFAPGFLASGAPRTDVSESDDAVEVSIELPGMDEKDIDVSLSNDVLTIRGEKKEEKEEKRKGYYLSERTFGVIQRSIPLPPGVDAEKVEATFRKGVLTVTLPKTAEARENVRRIAVKAE